MTTNRKGRAGCNQATPNTCKHTHDSTGLAAPIKAAIVTLVLWGLQVAYPAIWGFLATLAVSAPGLLHPSLVRRPYGAWGRLSRTARRAARLWLTGVAFLIITIVGRSGARMAWTTTLPGTSGWTPKRPLPPGSHRTTSDVAGAPGSDDGWVRSLAGWAGRSGNAWAWSLIPALALLKVVEGKPTRSLGGNVYTLY
jgi:hypothetical protein